MRHLPRILIVALFAAASCTPVGIQTTDTKDEGGGGDGGGGDGGGDADADADADSDTDTDADTDVTLPSCPAEPDTIGPWKTHPITEAGAGWTRDAYTADAGIDDLLAAAAGQTYPVAVSIPVTGAFVTARGYVPAAPTDNTVTMWLEDANGAMLAYRVDVGFDPNGINPGDEVAFTATEVEEYFGTPEITVISDFQVLSTGNDVHVVDGMAGPELTFADNGSYVVEVWGQLVYGPVDCSANCWDFEYNGNVITLRSGSSFDYLGDCIHWIGPVGQFSGAPQLDADDFDWYEWF